MKLVTVEEMRRLEREADAGGWSYATMMEQAGRAVAEAILARREVRECPVLVLVGPGNNGGDGLVAARYLQQAGASVTCYIGKRKNLDADENACLARERGVIFAVGDEDTDRGELCRLMSRAEVIVDALLGTGVSRPVEGVLKEVLTIAQEEVTRRRGPTRPALTTPAMPSYPVGSPVPYVVAVDVPSGVNCDTGAVDPATLPADLTVTFAYPKVGQYRFPAAGILGELVVADIGIPPHLADNISREVSTPDMVRDLLPSRPADAHKGTFGRAMIVAGSANYTGAAGLAGAAATRVGTGLVTLAVPESLHPVLAAQVSETTFLLLPENLGVLVPAAVEVLAEYLGNYQACLVGPGLGREKETVTFVQDLLDLHPPTRRKRVGFLQHEGREEHEEEHEKHERREKGGNLPPLVVDADGLNALSDTPGWWEHLPRGCILTPHPGEMARLLGCTTAEIQADRWQVAQEAAARWKQIIVLKGAFTCIAAPDGRLVINPFANPGLATAGSGDVLAGAIVGFLAQGLEPFAAAVVGTYVHGLAGELVRQRLGEAGMVAGDLLLALPQAIRRLRGK